MELVADGTAGVTEGIERVLAALELREDELAEAMLGAILGEIGPYDRPGGQALMKDVREHCRLHVDLLMRSLRAGRDPDRSDLSFARDAGARRVHQGIPLDGLLQAFRVGDRTLLHALVDEVAASAARPAGGRPRASPRNRGRAAGRRPASPARRWSTSTWPAHTSPRLTCGSRV